MVSDFITGGFPGDAVGSLCTENLPSYLPAHSSDLCERPVFLSSIQTSHFKLQSSSCPTLANLGVLGFRSPGASRPRATPSRQLRIVLNREILNVARLHLRVPSIVRTESDPNSRTVIVSPPLIEASREKICSLFCVSCVPGATRPQARSHRGLDRRHGSPVGGELAFRRRSLERHRLRSSRV